MNECCAPQYQTPLDVLLHLLSQMLHIGLFKETQCAEIYSQKNRKM